MNEENTLLTFGCSTGGCEVLALSHHLAHPDDKLYIEVNDDEDEDGLMIEMTRGNAMRLAGAIIAYYEDRPEPE